MTNKYLSFITDEDLFECIEFLYTEYEKALEGIDFDKFFKNRIDTFKMTFDMGINNLSEQDWLAAELQRQVEKTITNHVGTFHEKLIGKIEGYTNYPVGYDYDVAKDDNTLFAEIKNKHNTLTGTHTKSRNDIWEFRSGSIDENTREKPRFSHPRVRIASGDQFYKIVTGEEDAFKQLAYNIPIALDDWIETKRAKKGSSLGLFAELYQQAKANNRTLSEEIISINYPKSNYISF